MPWTTPSDTVSTLACSPLAWPVPAGVGARSRRTTVPEHDHAVGVRVLGQQPARRRRRAATAGRGGVDAAPTRPAAAWSIDSAAVSVHTL